MQIHTTSYELVEHFTVTDLIPLKQGLTTFFFCPVHE